MHGTQAGQQFASVEGLAHVVISAQFQTDDTVAQLVHGGEHDDRDAGAAAQLLAQVQAAFAGQHQVEDDGVRTLFFDSRPHRRAIGGQVDFVAMHDKELLQQGTNFHIVIDDQQSAHDQVQWGVKSAYLKLFCCAGHIFQSCNKAAFATQSGHQPAKALGDPVGRPNQGNLPCRHNLQSTALTAANP
ncbi:hypothetical protein D3C76_1231980 [compost metagenome]